MVDDLLPPSPNWYCSQASDCSEDGLFAYSTRSVVFLLDLRTSPPCYVGCLAGQAGHSNRVTAVKFGHGIRGKHLCATAGDDCTLRVWDVIGRAMKTEHHFHKEVTLACYLLVLFLHVVLVMLLKCLLLSVNTLVSI